MLSGCWGKKKLKFLSLAGSRNTILEIAYMPALAITKAVVSWFAFNSKLNQFFSSSSAARAIPVVGYGYQKGVEQSVCSLAGVHLHQYCFRFSHQAEDEIISTTSLVKN